MFQFADLRDKLATYLSQEEVEQISQAYLLAAKAHEGQYRSSGEPYISHPIEVARILANMHMDFESIMAAMLHDVLEDTSVSKRELEEKFGSKVAELVDGVSKLAQIKFETKIEAQASNLRKMMMAMSNDIRVILVKLADRLHNMRTLGVLRKEKQRRIAQETLEIYAPIAHRLGMNKFRVEFEDLGFSYMYPMRSKIFKDALKKARGNRKKLLNQIEENIKAKLLESKFKDSVVSSREKHLYSIYKKMRDKDLSLSEVMDIYAIRVVVQNFDECYRVLGIIHNLYNPVAGKFKDYIAVPKSNGYQSLHSIVIGPFGVPVEIQIRTDAMHKLAENGIAAHWIYKSQREEISNAEIRARKWLQGLLGIEKSAGNSKEFLDNVKFDLYPSEVYVFTPTGDISSLPKGSTAVDFAYNVHTDVGNTCIAAKIDRKFVPLSTRLENGQTIEIITSKSSSPNPAWLRFVVTGKARSNIRHWLKNQEASESIRLGKRLLERSLATLSIKLDDITEERFTEILIELKLATKDNLYSEIGLGNKIAQIIANKLSAYVDVTTKPEAPLAIMGTEGMVVSYSKCCKPIPGDDIVGYLSSGRGMDIHREACSKLPKSSSAEKEQVVFVKWSNKVKGFFKVELQVEILNKRGALANVANAISTSDANIDNVNIDERDARHNILTFLIEVKSRKHLATVIKNIKRIELITKVIRQ